MRAFARRYWQALGGFTAALVIVGFVLAVVYVVDLRTEAATAHEQAAQGEKAWAYLEQVVLKNPDGSTLTVGGALVQIINAQVAAAKKAAPPAPPPAVK